MATKPKPKTTKPPVAKQKKQVAPKKVAKKPAKKSLPSTEFSLFAPDASEVFLIGDLTNWNTTEFKMRKFKDGNWKKMVTLKPGRYEYLFLVDGEWWTDPENPDSTGNPFGSKNSVITIGDL
nr:isoamylase early set domain-containing protein [Desulfobulbaceae bacterium]